MASIFYVVSDSMLYVTLNRPLADIIVFNAHVPTEDESDYTEYGFYGELERVFDKFPKYRMKILLADLNANVGKDDRFTLTILNDISGEARDCGRVKIVKLCDINATGKYVLGKVMYAIPYEVLSCILTL
jgi:hypothetical protein